MLTIFGLSLLPPPPPGEAAGSGARHRGLRQHACCLHGHAAGQQHWKSHHQSLTWRRRVEEDDFFNVQSACCQTHVFCGSKPNALFYIIITINIECCWVNLSVTDRVRARERGDTGET